MTEDDKPIFPRSNDTTNEEKQNLFEETKQKLKNSENKLDEPFTFCGKCGAEVPLGAKFCRNCGADLKPAPISPSISESPPDDFPPAMERLPMKLEEETSFTPPASIMYGPPPTMVDEPSTKTEEFPNFETVNQLSPDEIHTTMYGPAPMKIEEAIPLPTTEPDLKIEKENALVTGLNYEEWKPRIPWLIIGAIFGFLLASVIILTLVLLVVALR